MLRGGLPGGRGFPAGVGFSLKREAPSDKEVRGRPGLGGHWEEALESELYSGEAARNEKESGPSPRGLAQGSLPPQGINPLENVGGVRESGDRV